jgi:hypothetical protein
MKWRVRSRRRADRISRLLNKVKVGSTERNKPLQYDNAIDRLCVHILPKIHDKIKWLSLEFLSIERILLAAIYPNLSGLCLYNIDMNTADHLFHGKKFDLNLIYFLSNLYVYLGKSSVLNIFKNQISSLFIKFDNDNPPLRRYAATNIFTCALTIVTGTSISLYISFLSFVHM